MFHDNTSIKHKMAELHVWLAQFAVDCIGKDGPIFFDADLVSHNHFLSPKSIYVPEGENIKTYGEKVLDTLDHNDSFKIGKKGSKITKQDVTLFLEKLKEHADCEIFANGRTYASPCLYGKGGRMYESESIVEKAVEKIADECSISDLNALHSAIRYSRPRRYDEALPDLATVYENVFKSLTMGKGKGAIYSGHEPQVVDREKFIASLKKHLQRYFDSAIKHQQLFEGQVLGSDDDDHDGDDDYDPDEREGAESYSISWSS